MLNLINFATKRGLLHSRKNRTALPLPLRTSPARTHSSLPPLRTLSHWPPHTHFTKLCEIASLVRGQDLSPNSLLHEAYRRRRAQHLALGDLYELLVTNGLEYRQKESGIDYPLHRGILHRRDLNQIFTDYLALLRSGLYQDHPPLSFEKFNTVVSLVNWVTEDLERSHPSLQGAFSPRASRHC